MRNGAGVITAAAAPPVPTALLMPGHSPDQNTLHPPYDNAHQGMLSIGAAIMGASTVTGVDIDEDALCVAQRNMTQFEDDLPVSLRCPSALYTADALPWPRDDLDGM